MTAKITILEGDDPDRHMEQTAWDRSVAKGRVKPRPRDEVARVVRPNSSIREAVKRGFHYWVVPGRISTTTTRALNDPRFDADRGRDK